MELIIILLSTLVVLFAAYAGRLRSKNRSLQLQAELQGQQLRNSAATISEWREKYLGLRQRARYYIQDKVSAEQRGEAMNGYYRLRE